MSTTPGQEHLTKWPLTDSTVRGDKTTTLHGYKSLRTRVTNGKLHRQQNVKARINIQQGFVTILTITFLSVKRTSRLGTKKKKSTNQSEPQITLKH